MTICEVCHEAIATVHLTEIVHNAKKEIHLCEACASQKGVAIHAHVKNISIPEFFGQLVESRDESGSDPADIHCETCGIGYRQFRASGKLGCPDDFQAFRRELDHLLEKIHGSSRHRGKVPGRIGREIVRRRELEDLRGELHSAVSREEYERAASLRDRIHEIERGEPCS